MDLAWLLQLLVMKLLLTLILTRFSLSLSLTFVFVYIRIAVMCIITTIYQLNLGSFDFWVSENINPKQNPDGQCSDRMGFDKCLLKHMIVFKTSGDTPLYMGRPVIFYGAC